MVFKKTLLQFQLREITIGVTVDYKLKFDSCGIYMPQGWMLNKCSEQIKDYFAAQDKESLISCVYAAIFFVILA